MIFFAYYYSVQLKGFMSTRTACPTCGKNHSGECRYAKKQPMEKTTCPICKREHLGECRYAKKPEEKQAEKQAEKQDMPGACFKYGGYRWSHVEGKTIYFDMKPHDIFAIEIALDRTFNLNHGGFRGFALQDGESPFEMAISIINLLADLDQEAMEDEFIDEDQEEYTPDDA